MGLFIYLTSFGWKIKLKINEQNFVMSYFSIKTMHYFKFNDVLVLVSYPTAAIFIQA